MKKILFINSSLTSGGSERVMTLLANEFAQRGYEVSMVLLRELKPDVYILNSNINVIRFEYGTKNKVIILLKRMYKLRRLFLKNKFDAAIAFMVDINCLALICGMGINLPIIISERADPSRENFIYRYIEKMLYPKAKKLVCQTPHVVDLYDDNIKKLGIVIPNPVNSDLPYVKEKIVEKKIVTAGRMTEQKDFETLIKAYAKFHIVYPEYTLEIFGKGALAEKLKSLAKDLGVENSVYFHGFVNNLPDYFSEASMYVSTSIYEGISNAMIEAMAIGLPCVCTDCPVGGAHMMIENNVNGILVEIGNEEQICSSMLKIAGDKDFAKSLGSNAKKIREKYSIERIANKWAELID
ncbi:MAG: glycosyltransferase family 4 protein [Lachnospiraceae bacterium]|nr:glycosyltransferase family 4 protein [Lachnospiraceae bacterium]